MKTVNPKAIVRASKNKADAKPRTRAAKGSADNRPPAVRDNVLGRRPSKIDPLGEQPGTVAQNLDQLGDPAPEAGSHVPVTKRK